MVIPPLRVANIAANALSEKFVAMLLAYSSDIVTAAAGRPP